MKQIYKINNEKFKSIFISLNYTMKVTKEELSQTAVLASILSKSSKKYKNQGEIEKYLFKLYGANFDVNVQKIGDLYDLEFKIGFVNKKYLPGNVDILSKCLEFLYEIIYNPNIENGTFDSNFVEREKIAILEKVKQRKDNKIMYAILNTEELLCKGKVSGYYLFGDEEVIPTITSEQIYNRYNSVINDSCITMVISGNLSGYENIDDEICNIFSNKLDTKYKYTDLVVNDRSEDTDIKLNESEMSQDTNQSVITFGMKIKDVTPRDFSAINMYNAILGSTASSKLFQNFREKESLAYTVRSRYYRFKDIIIIYAGIKKEDYERAKVVINEQLDQIVNADITEEEFNAAKESLLSDLIEWEDNKVAIAKMFISNLFAFKNDSMIIEQMYENMKNVTLQDVVDIAKRIKTEQIYFLRGETDV